MGNDVRDGFIANVPVKISGVVVGRAVVYSDGRIEAHLNGNTMGRQTYEFLRADMCRDISLIPNLIPAIPVEPQHDTDG